MAFNKQVKRNFIIVFWILIVGPLSLIATFNIDCNGKAFHCVNSTHFKICVDFGGISKTVDDFLIPCPESTVCTDNNYFECEYQITTTPVSVIGNSDVTNKNSDLILTTAFDALHDTTINPIEYENKTEQFENYYDAVSTTSSDVNYVMTSSGKENTFTYTPWNEIINQINRVGNKSNNTITEKEKTNVKPKNLQKLMTFNLTDMNITTPTYIDNKSEILTDLTETTTTVRKNIKLNEIKNETISSFDSKSTSTAFFNELSSTSTIKSDLKYREQDFAIDQNNDELSTIRTLVNDVIGTNNSTRLSNVEQNSIVTNAPFTVKTMIKSVNDVPVTISINTSLKDAKVVNNGIVNILSSMINQKNSDTGAIESSKGLLNSMITESSNKAQLADNEVDSVTVIDELPYLTIGSDYFVISQNSVNDTADNNIYSLSTPTSHIKLTTNNNSMSSINLTADEATMNQISTEETTKDKLEFISTRKFSNTSPRSVTKENFSTVQELLIDKVNILKNNGYNISTSSSGSEISLLDNDTMMSQRSLSSETKISSVSINFIELENQTNSYLTDTEQISTIKSDNYDTLTTSNNIIPTLSTEESLSGARQKLMKPDFNSNQIKISDTSKNDSEISSNFLEIHHTTTLPTMTNINLFSTTVYEKRKFELSTSSNNTHHNNYNISIKESFFIGENGTTELLSPKEQSTVRPNMYSMRMTTKDTNNLSVAVNKTMNHTILETSKYKLDQLNKIIDPSLPITIQNFSNTVILRTESPRNSFIPLIVSGSSLANEEQNNNITDMRDNGDITSTTIVTQTLYNNQDLKTDMYNNNNIASTPLPRMFLNADNNVTISTLDLNVSSNKIGPYLTQTEQMPIVLDFLSTPKISSDSLPLSTLIPSINTVQDLKDETDAFNNMHILTETTSDIPFNLFDYGKVFGKYIADNDKNIHLSTIDILTTTPAPINLNTTTKMDANNKTKIKVSILENGKSKGSLTEVGSSLNEKSNLNNLLHDKINLDLHVNYVGQNIILSQDDILQTPIHIDERHFHSSNDTKNLTIDMNVYTTTAIRDNTINENIATEASDISKNNNSLHNKVNESENNITTPVPIYHTSKLNEMKHSENIPSITALEYVAAVNSTSQDYAYKDINSTYNDIGGELPTSTESIKMDSLTNFENIAKTMDVIIGGSLSNLNHSYVLDKETIMMLNKNYSDINNNLLNMDSKITKEELEVKNNSILFKPGIDHNITMISNKIRHSIIPEVPIVTTIDLNFVQIDTMTDIPKNIITTDINNISDYNGTTIVSEFSNIGIDTDKTSKPVNMFTKMISKNSIENEIKVIYLNETNKVSGKEAYNKKLDLNTLSNDTLLSNNLPLITSSIPSTEFKTTIHNLTYDLNYGENDYIHNLLKNQRQSDQYNITRVDSIHNENTLNNTNVNYLNINTNSNVRLNETTTLKAFDEKLGMLKLSEANKTRTHNLYIANVTMTTAPTNGPNQPTHSMIVNNVTNFKSPLHFKLINSQAGSRIYPNMSSNSTYIANLNMSTIQNTLKTSLNNISDLSIKDILQVKVKDTKYNTSLLENAENLVAPTTGVSKLNEINYFNKSDIFNNTNVTLKNNDNTNISLANSINIKNYSLQMFRDQIVNKQIKTYNFNKNYSAGSNALIKKLSNSYFNCKNYRNGKYPDKNDCTKFYICIGRNEPIIGTCPNNTVFSEIKKHCTKNLSYCVRNNQFLCKSVGRYIDVFSNQFYYICVRESEHFIRLKLQCNKGYHLETTKIGCVLDSLNMSNEDTSYTTRDESTVESTSKEEEELKIKKKNFVCEVEGNFPYPDDCRKFYSCVKKSKSEFRRRIKKCDSDEVFNKEKKKCVDDYSYDCDSNE